MKWLKDCHIHIEGLGLMGASLAMALRGKVAHLSGKDIQASIEAEALAQGVVEEIGGCERADIVILAIPADYIIGHMRTMNFKPGVLVTDLGGSKKQICDYMDSLPEGVCAVGGHPMCGLAENGYRNAIPTLYAGARFILCETTRTTDESRSLMEQLAGAVGSLPLWLDRETHDQTAGAVSHLPHLMSFALMRLAMQLADENEFVWELAAGGFDGATRLARTNEAMIMGMFRTNENQLRQLVERLRDHLDYLTTLLDDPEALRHELSLIVSARRDYTLHYGERMIT